MSSSQSKPQDRWSQLNRQELIALGRTIVTERLEDVGCTVATPPSQIRGSLEVGTPTGRSLELFVSTQRVGGYVFWTKRRFQPATDRLAAIVLLTEAEHPSVYVLPSTEWLHAAPPLTDRPNVGKRSEPEYGVSLARSSLDALHRYIWEQGSGNDQFR